MVPGEGLEPSHLAAADFESAASTDSAIPAIQSYGGAILQAIGVACVRAQNARRTPGLMFRRSAGTMRRR